MNKLTKTIRILLLIVEVIFIFIAGLMWTADILMAIIIFLVGILILILRELGQSFIRGEGVDKITVGKNEPKAPQVGDLWIDTE